MMKRALVIILGFVGFSFPLAAQRSLDSGSIFAFYRPEIFTTVDSSVLLHDLPVLTLLDGQRLPVSSELGRMGRAPLDLFPVAFLRVAKAHQTQKVKASAVYRTAAKDSPAEVIESRVDPLYYGGEVGVLYGQWTGKYGGEVMQGYMTGTVGNDKVQITAGAEYEESNVRVPRFRSFGPPR